MLQIWNISPRICKTSINTLIHVMPQVSEQRLAFYFPDFGDVSAR